MGVVEIILIIVGAVICILGYLMPARKEDMDETFQLISEDEVRKVVDKEVGEAKAHIADIIDETVSYAIEKTERSMERVTNEKIMAVNEYSDTVLEEINKNHKEVLFLYDMLNDKHDNLKDTVSEASKTAEEIKQTVRDAEITAKETQESVKEVENTVREAEDAVRAVMTAALEAQGRSTASAYAEIDARNVSRDAELSAYRRETRDAGAAEYGREVRDFRIPEYATEVPDIGIPEFDGEVPDIGIPEFDGDDSDTAEIETGREADYLEAMEVARAAAYSGRAEEDQFVPIAPPRVEIIHDPDSEYDYIAESSNEPLQMSEPLSAPSQGDVTEKGPVNIQFANIENGKNNGRNSNERILELHKAGKSNMAIAKELGLGIGEVKLVIDLFEGL